MKRSGAESEASPPCPSGGPSVADLETGERTCSSFDEVRWWCRTQCKSNIMWITGEKWKIEIAFHSVTFNY